MIFKIFIALFIVCCDSLKLNMKIAVVTGANKGIGFEIAKKIGANGFRTVLACRSEKLGKEAERKLKKLGYDAEYRQLDVGQPAGFASFVAGLDRDYGKVDVLVNNAAILFKPEDSTPVSAQAKPTLDINFYGTLKLTETMLPLLRQSTSPRIVNVASQLGHLDIIKKASLRQTFESADSTLTLPELVTWIEKFQADVEAGKHTKEGWPTGVYGVYGMSKLGLIAATKILARQESNILVNACCPGYCDTDMTAHQGPRSAEHGARTPSLLALSLSDGGPTGLFYSDERPVNW